MAYMKCISVLGDDIVRAITCSQANSFGRVGIEVIEEALSNSLYDGLSACSDLLAPIPEMQNDEECATIVVEVLRVMGEGIDGAISKWTKRVTPTLELCKFVEYFRPLWWVVEGKTSTLPIAMTEDILTKYGKYSRETGPSAVLQWRKYRKIVEAHATMYRSLDIDSDERLALIEKLDEKRFWSENRSKMQSLFTVVNHVFAFCPSAAEVERSFKKLRAILPKDHSRDCIQESMLSKEMFFSFNRSHLQLFQ
tara:strand:+ start:3251 stop:4006 length:756 start_codon:yes stop_codon:yes gene_type:complete